MVQLLTPSTGAHRNVGGSVGNWSSARSGGLTSSGPPKATVNEADANGPVPVASMAATRQNRSPAGRAAGGA